MTNYREVNDLYIVKRGRDAARVFTDLDSAEDHARYHKAMVQRLYTHPDEFRGSDQLLADFRPPVQCDHRFEFDYLETVLCIRNASHRGWHLGEKADRSFVAWSDGGEPRTSPMSSEIGEARREQAARETGE